MYSIQALLNCGWRYGSRFLVHTKQYPHYSVECRNFSKDNPNLNPSNAQHLEKLYNQWVNDPKTVEPSWDLYFRSLAAGTAVPPDTHPSSHYGKNQVPLGHVFAKIKGCPGPGGSSSSNPTSGGSSGSSQNVAQHLSVQGIIRNYQTRGHLIANLDPLGIMYKDKATTVSDLRGSLPEEIVRHQKHLANVDKDAVYTLPPTTYIGADKKELPFKEIIHRLENVYCRHIGAEYMYINDMEKTKWIAERLETPGSMKMTNEEKLKLWERLVRATKLESYFGKKWTSEKRFGLEGCESVVPCLKQLMDTFSEQGVESFIIGMSHRGRLNALVNVCHKQLSKLFTQFIGLEPADLGAGDIKYHLGTNVEMINKTTKKKVKIVLLANPSHLEHVNPLVLGKAKAEQFFKNDTEGKTVVPILLHGDSSFCGQGINFETIQLSDLPFFTTHGVIHVVVNNQIGFTTDPRYYRSSPYATDVARVLNEPIFHVNADDPESVMFVSKVAAEWRTKFREGVVLDVVGYRRYGHNEVDEPSFTQPLMYKKIAATKPILELYTDRLTKEGVLTKETIERVTNEYIKLLEDGLVEAKKETSVKLSDWLDSPWKGFAKPKDRIIEKPTGVKEEVLKHISEKFSSPPPNNFVVHKGVKRILDGRMELAKARTINWAMGEALAIGSLVKDGIHVRFTGQDVERGTFSHRHHVLHHQEIDKTVYNSLENLYPDQAKYHVGNSSLNELGTLGFQVGYAMHDPNTLVMWEAQFGDFANTATSMIDNYIIPGEAKWARQLGIVLLLPHGFEGAGPEHSNARVERYLQATNDDPDILPQMDDKFAIKQLIDINTIVVNCTTPANYFHILRRQVCLNFRKPLIIMAPKSLLKNRLVISSFDDMLEGTTFQRLIPEKLAKNPKKVLFCSGRIYYDLFEEREKRKLVNDIALIRIEQLSPFPYDLVQAECEKYKDLGVWWAQEEHKNGGPWPFVQSRFDGILNKLGRRICYVGRASSASTATGNKLLHLKEFNSLMDDTMQV